MIQLNFAEEWHYEDDDDGIPIEVSLTYAGTTIEWEAASGKPIATLQGHSDPVLSAQFSPDGKWVVTASDDKTAILYPYESFAPVDYLRARSGPDIARIASGRTHQTVA
jgi:WD40 repeat protein